MTDVKILLLVGIFVNIYSMLFMKNAKNKILLLVLFVTVLIIVITLSVLYISPNDHESIDIDESTNDDTVERTVVEEELNKLPHEVIVRGKTVVFDQDSVKPKPRDEYAQLPYEIDIENETRLVETSVEFLPGETPLEFVARIMEEQVPSQEELDATSDELYQYSVSFHRMDEEDVAMYPSADHPDATLAEEGLSVYVRQMNLPDDSVGGTETRYDFIVSENRTWVFVWQGERNLCRRQGHEVWRPGDQPCP